MWCEYQAFTWQFSSREIYAEDESFAVKHCNQEQDILFPFTLVSGYDFASFSHLYIIATLPNCELTPNHFSSLR